MGKIWDKIRGIRDRSRPFCSVIIPAAGASIRMGGGSKQLMDLCGAPVLMRTLCVVDRAERVDEIIVATREDMLETVAEMCSRAGLQKPARVILGGNSRLESVLAGALEADPRAELLAVHDGNRPLIRPEEFDEVVRHGAITYAVAPAIPVSSTIKIVDENMRIKSTPNRSELYCAQTPQVFQADILKAALQSAMDAGVSVTDDCSAVERLGKDVYLIPGDPENIKITVPLDMVIAEAILKRREREQT